jgi:integrase/recombinase XerD
MPTVKLELFKSKSLKDGRHPIMLRITHERRNKYIKTGLSAFPEEWDKKSMQLTTTYKKNFKLAQPRFESLNAALLNKLADALNDSFELQREKHTLNIDELKAKIKKVSKSAKMYEFSEKIIKENKSKGSIGNAANYQTMLNVVKKFHGEKELKITDIDFAWLKQFDSWCQSKGNSVNSISVYVRALRALYNRAIAEGLVTSETYPFGKGKYKIAQAPTQKRAINKDDINKIKKARYPENSSLWHTKNLFLFSFYCRGMNWIDMAHLRLKNIVNGRIEYIRIKTKRKSGKAFSIKINGQIKDILDWYCKGKESKDYIFPIIFRKENPELARKDIKNGLKSFNKYLKKIAEKCKIQGDITSYVSRHSWATIAKKIGVDIAVISDGLGHADMHVTQIYLDSIDNEDIDKANELVTF